MLNNVLAQAQATGEADQASKDRLTLIYRSALKLTMQANLNK
jgi:hypothetical protein